MSNDYNDIEGVERAVQRQQQVDSGMGLLGKANKSSLKRKSADVSEMLSKAKRSGKDEFSAKIKSMKYNAARKDKKDNRK